MFRRRTFLRTLAATAFAPALRAQSDVKYPPVRTITRGPKFHWFGYYDKDQFDSSERFVLGSEVDFERRSPTPDDVIKVGTVDLHDGDKWIELGETHAWNWQQGCMLQWVPGTESTVMWNAREGDEFVCHLRDVKTRQKRSIPHPVYALSPDGRWGIAPDFRRLAQFAGVEPALSRFGDVPPVASKGGTSCGQSRLYIAVSQIEPLPRFAPAQPDIFEP